MSRPASRPLRRSSVLVAAFSAGALSLASPIAAAEPPVQPAGAAAQPIVGYERDAELLGYEREATVESYKRLGKRDPKWDGPLIAFLEDVARYRSGVESRKSVEELITDGEALMKLGCKESVLYAAFGGLCVTRPKDTRGTVLLHSAITRLPKDGYAPTVVGHAAWALAHNYTDLGQEAGALSSWFVAGDAFQSAMREPGMSPGRQRWLFAKLNTLIRRALPPDLARELVKQTLEDDQVPRWLAHTLAGTQRIREGWDARGAGYANTVTPEGWRAFAEHLGEARRHFEAAYALLPQNPEPAAAMITVAMAGHAAEGEDELFWFDRAVAAQLDWLPAYNNMIWALRPRWGGSHAKMVSFGYRCAATRRYDTVVPAYMVTAIARAADDLQGHDTFWRAPGLYDDIARVLSATAADPRHQESAGYYRSLHAVIAWRAGRYRDTRRLLDELGDEFDLDVAQTVRGHGWTVINDSKLYTSAAEPLVREADVAQRAGRWERAAELYDQALGACAPADGLLRHSLNDRLAVARWQASFEKGEWTPLPLEKGIFGWRPRAGSWVPGEGGAVVGTPGETGLILLADTSFGPRWEFRAEIDLAKADAKGRANAGIAFAYEYRGDKASWLSFRIDHAKMSATIGRRWGVSRRTRVANLGTTVQMHLQIYDELAVARVNGTIVFAGRLPIKSVWDPRDAIGLCGDYKTDRGEVLFRSIEIRRLDQPPPEVKSAAAPAAAEGDEPEDRPEGGDLPEAPPV